MAGVLLRAFGTLLLLAPLSVGQLLPQQARRCSGDGGMDEQACAETVPLLAAALEDGTPDALLDALFFPLSRSQFFRRVWQRQPHHMFHGRSRKSNRGLTEGAELAFAAGDFEQYLDRFAGTTESKMSGGPLAAFVDVLLPRDGVMPRLPGHPHVQPADAAEYITERGNSLVVREMQVRLNSTAHLAAGLESALGGYHVSVELYYTPSNAQGLSAHYDSAETFVLQLKGSKHWTIYRPPVPLPRDHEPRLPTGKLDTNDSAIIKQVTLRAGEALYIPRGWVQEAATRSASGSSSCVDTASAEDGATSVERCEGQAGQAVASTHLTVSIHLPPLSTVEGMLQVRTFSLCRDIINRAAQREQQKVEAEACPVCTLLQLVTVLQSVSMRVEHAHALIY